MKKSKTAFTIRQRELKTIFGRTVPSVTFKTKRGEEDLLHALFIPNGGGRPFYQVSQGNTELKGFHVAHSVVYTDQETGALNLFVSDEGNTWVRLHLTAKGPKATIVPLFMVKQTIKDNLTDRNPNNMGVHFLRWLRYTGQTVNIFDNPQSMSLPV